MIINSAPQNEAVLSNVGEIGEFRIRNSAKAFNILSSGLYANKIKAIIRELSCNAVDSHVAAKKQDTPFDVHLPNQLEPWFSIRDYGTGLSHEQVTQIYTTYFESTKTASNEFIGALGLGSKSPFSYTDNFTVTAVQGGKKGIYSAFINEAGVPSIAQMMTEETTDPDGVEVKFSVNDRWDFDKFRQEAREVYTYFKLQPVISGYDLTIAPREYEAQDIIPGVHQYSNNRRSYGSIAIMGNIAYPIDIPRGNDDAVFRLLNCNLEMHFGIGELDFQASREGLSYIPQTIESIRKKLDALNAVLASKIAEEADQIKNLWDRAVFLHDRRSNDMWTAPVDQYIVSTKFPLWNDMSNGHYYSRPKVFKFSVAQLAKKYNISIVAFTKNRGSNTTHTINPNREHVKKGATFEYVPTWEIGVGKDTYFVKNDTKIGAAERAKYHWRHFKHDNPKDTPYSAAVFVMSPIDRTKPAQYDKFMKNMCNPPVSRIANASTLLEKPRKVVDGTVSAKNVTIMKLCERNSGGYYRSQEMVWRDAGKADTFDSTKTYYYVPLSGYNMEIEAEYSTAKSLHKDITESGVIPDLDLYGVRKGDIKWVETQANWVNIEKHVKNLIGNLDSGVALSYAKSELGRYQYLRYNDGIVSNVTDVNSPYILFVNKLKDVPVSSYDKHYLDRLCSNFKVQSIDVTTLVESMKQECEALYQRYPLFSSLRDLSYDSVNRQAVAEYINVIDSTKGV